MEEKADRQERELAGIRDNLGDLMGELDQRRHRLAPRTLVRAHPVAAISLGIAAMAAVAGGILLHTWRNRRQRTPSARLSRLTAALKGAIGTRVPVAKTPPSTWGRILIPVSTAIAVTVARKLVTRYFNRT